MSVPALITVFNHRYEANIPRLEELYSPRFSVRKYVVPFAQSPNPQVIRVFENGWTFSGHIAQAAIGYVDPAVSHYIFLADDLILNPSLNEANLAARLGLDDGTGFIKSLTPSDNLRYSWPWAGRSTMNLISPGFDYKSELPPAAEAGEKFTRMGFTFASPHPRTMREAVGTVASFFSRRLAFSQLVNTAVTGRRSAYPLLAGYSDFVVVPAKAIHAFAAYCGVFAAMNLFAEVAVPTALALACDSVRTELAYGQHFTDAAPSRNPAFPMHAVELWGDDITAFGDSLQYDFARLLREFPENRLYIHPIKLSRWMKRAAA